MFKNMWVLVESRCKQKSGSDYASKGCLIMSGGRREVGPKAGKKAASCVKKDLRKETRSRRCEMRPTARGTK